MPTGVALRQARELLFDAADRVLLRDGPSGLTSRAVTTEAGVAKGVLHRHFADFDAFLLELVLDRSARVEDQAATLRQAAGTGIVADNLTDALVALFGPVSVAIVGLVISRHELRARWRDTGSKGVPILTEAVAMIAAYLKAERELGRIAYGPDADTLAPMLIGAAHLLFSDRDATAARSEAIHKVVTSAIAGVVQRPLS